MTVQDDDLRVWGRPTQTLHMAEVAKLRDEIGRLEQEKGYLESKVEELMGRSIVHCVRKGCNGYIPPSRLTAGLATCNEDCQIFLLRRGNRMKVKPPRELVVRNCVVCGDVFATRWGKLRCPRCRWQHEQRERKKKAALTKAPQGFQLQ